MNFKKINTLTGWLVFAIAAFTYLRTIEPTASFWDCGEFTACAYKLEVGHQPGAPFFLILGRLFSIFASEKTEVAGMINTLSAIASAFTIMFLFWTITILAGKITSHQSNRLYTQLIVTGSGLTGALACAFSDTFWFSAVEGEVYATSSLFTAVVFWLILKWEEETDKNPVYADRWIILIMYLMGLSVGVHLLNLLTIPALVLVYYFKKYTPTTKGFLASLLVSFALLGLMVFIFIPWTIKFAAWFDLLFVNGFKMPLNSGSFFFLFLMVAGIVLMLNYSHKQSRLLLNKVLLAFAVLLIGYSSYIILAIRADANPPVNMNKVNNPWSLMQYINREQYVSRPIFYGPCYNAPITGYKSNYTYIPVNGQYKKTSTNPAYKFDRRYMTVFPRMSSTDPQDIAAYKKWAGIKNDKMPTFSQNLYFFFRYQVGYMYLRYFMWNFAGRQNENQGTGDVMNGNWISGIPLFDEIRLGKQEHYPNHLKENKGRNKYYMMPLLLGLIGMTFHFRKRRKDSLVVLFFFLMTGLAIVIYLNEIPQTPRERDYAVGGSFYVFCIWLGLGVYGLFEWLSKKTPSVISLCLVLTACGAVPVLMGIENTDDHDRSQRYLVRDYASNYLNSCAPGAILFSNADNDTYPIWYIQEVEGVREDVRVILAPFLNADWYIKQLSEWQNDAPPIQISIPQEKYASGKLNYIPFYKRTDNPATLKDVLDFIKSDDPRVLLATRDDSQMNYYPTNKFVLPVKGNSAPVSFTVDDHALAKHLIVILDIIATNNWEKPVYFLSTQIPDELGLTDYLQLDGFAYRLVPDKKNDSGFANAGNIIADELYEKMMHTFRWGNMNSPGVFMDYNSIRTTNVMGMRNTFARLAEELIKQGKSDKAMLVLDRCMEIMPDTAVPFDAFILRIITGYINAGAVGKAKILITDYERLLIDELNYYQSLTSWQAKGLESEIGMNQYVLKQIEEINNQLALIND
jgi:MFS family permease